MPPLVYFRPFLNLFEEPQFLLLDSGMRNRESNTHCCWGVIVSASSKQREQEVCVWIEPVYTDV